MLLNMLKRLSGPREVVAGPDSTRRLQALSGSSAVLVTSPSSQENGTQTALTMHLEKAGLSVSTVEVSSGEPTLDTCSSLAHDIREAVPDWIVAVGGGSVLDAAKIAWAMYEHPDIDFLGDAFQPLPPLREKARLITIPTVAGAGSEASRVAVLKNVDSGSVVPLVSEEWIPDITILDPKLTVSVPPSLTATCGMDALTHAIESYVSRLSGPLIRVLAGSATDLLLSHLPDAVSEPGDLQARESVLNGAYLAGLTQSAASTGLSHALTHASSAVLGSSHAMGNALFLHPTMKLNAAADPSTYSQLAEDLKLETDALFDAIGELTNNLALPARLQDIAPELAGIDLSAIAKAAHLDVCYRTNPFQASMDETISLLDGLS